MFIKRLRTVEITGISLHSYSYAWAERARTVGIVSGGEDGMQSWRLTTGPGESADLNMQIMSESGIFDSQRSAA